MNTYEYWHQRASTWVSVAVLTGGLLVAFILLFTYRLENSYSAVGDSYEEISQGE